MMRSRRGAVLVALGAVVTMTATACSSGGSSSSAGGGSGSTSATKGGTLYMVGIGPQEHWDPQRTYIGADIEFASRAFYRSLVTYTAGKDPKLTPDLATDLGTNSDGGKTWKFTLRSGVKWQDGKPVTCEDLKYGISRTFAQDVITGGPNYIINFLDIPKDAKGASQYSGPYTKKGQALFDKAVTCDGNTITYHFKTPWNDFNVATAGLAAFSPYRQDKDQGAKSDFAIFSDGPYQLQGTFDPNKGGTFVRNPNWDAASDPVRKAYPDKIEYQLGVQTETVYQRILADSGNDKNAVAITNAPASLLPQIASNPKGAQLTVNVPAPYVDYMVPNTKSKVFSNPKVRQALAVATDKQSYITALGGTQAAEATNALCVKSLPCYKDFNPFNQQPAGDPAAAKQLLQEAGVQTPVNIKVVYRSRPTYDKALAALKAGWDKAGFNVQLEGLTTAYYSTIQGPAYADRDVYWASWGADWPSGSTVIPALFDSRVNISAGGSGQDYGYYSSDAVNKSIDDAYKISDPAAREKAWGDIDEQIAKDGAAIPLINQKFVFGHGSNVKNYETNPLLGGYTDIANIAVQ